MNRSGIGLRARSRALEAGKRAGAAGKQAGRWLIVRLWLWATGLVWRIWWRILSNLYWRRVRALWRIAKSALYRYWDHDGDPMAGYIAYSVFLSIFPFAIFATSVASTFILPAKQTEAVDALFQLAPPHIAETLRPVVVDVASPRGGAVITFSAVIALYVASNAVEAIRMGFERAYQVRKPAHWIVSRLRAIAFVVLASFSFIFLGVLIIGLPLGLQIAEQAVGFKAPYGVTFMRYLVAVATFPIFLYQLHVLLPSQRPPRRRLRPGIVTTMVLWVLAATVFSTYLLYTPYYSTTYGAMAGVIVTLFFFYLSGAIILFGAEVNAVLMKFRAPTRQERTE